MTNEQILKKAIEKAVENGYKAYWTDSFVNVFYTERKDGDKNILLEFGQLKMLFNLEAIIFSHDFAKAFWGGGEKKFGEIVWKSSWQNHLQQMVLEEEPLKYLEKFV